jgi:outer membrane protein assembly factor BamB
MGPGKSIAGLAFLVVLPLAATRAENWPSWRGPDNNGISHETKLPIAWGAGKNVAWKLELPGKGGSTPAIWGKRLFVTGGTSDRLFLCGISTDGKLLWERKLASTRGRGFMRDEANEASASPSTDGMYVFAFVATGDLACFDFDGKEIWKFNVQDRYGRFQIQHGMHSTPLLYQDRLYVSLQHSNGHWLICLDKMTGQEKWKVERPTDAKSECKEAYTSPCLWPNAKEPCIVILGCDYVTGHRLDDGTELWRVGGLNSSKRYMPAFRIIASPVATPDLMVSPTARGLTVVAVKPGGTGIILPGNPYEAWRKDKGSPDVPSPLIQGGQVYLCRENGTLICLDANTGKQLYQEFIHDSRYRASPVYADGKIYLTARDGTFHVIKAGPMYQLLAENTLPDQFTASPAISGGRIYLRGFRALYAIE